VYRARHSEGRASGPTIASSLGSESTKSRAGRQLANPREACLNSARIEASNALDPDSLSGKARKARKARDYGILLVAESWLLERWPGCH